VAEAQLRFIHLIFVIWLLQVEVAVELLLEFIVVLLSAAEQVVAEVDI
jgi:hypothetical protein